MASLPPPIPPLRDDDTLRREIERYSIRQEIEHAALDADQAMRAIATDIARELGVADQVAQDLAGRVLADIRRRLGRLETARERFTGAIMEPVRDELARAQVALGAFAPQATPGDIVRFAQTGDYRFLTGAAVGEGESTGTAPPPTVSPSPRTGATGMWALYRRRDDPSRCVCSTDVGAGDEVWERIGGPYVTFEECARALQDLCRRPPPPPPPPPEPLPETKWFVVRLPDGTCGCARAPANAPPPNAIAGPYDDEATCRNVARTLCPPPPPPVTCPDYGCSPPRTIRIPLFADTYLYVRRISDCEVELIECRVPCGAPAPPDRPGYTLVGPIPQIGAPSDDVIARWFASTQCRIPGVMPPPGPIPPPPVDEEGNIIEEAPSDVCLLARPRDCPDFDIIDRTARGEMRDAVGFCGDLDFHDWVQFQNFLKCGRPV